jgi:hypothetical protein
LLAFQDPRAPLRRLEISFSQGAEWKALISTYIGTIPLSGDACEAEQGKSGGPPGGKTFARGQCLIGIIQRRRFDSDFV